MRINKRFISFIFAFLLLSCAANAENIKIDGAEIEWHKYYDNVYIITSDYVIPKVEQFKDKIVLEFKDVQAANFRATLKKSPRIKVIYPKLKSENVIQVIIELKKPVKYEMAALYGKGQVFVEIAETERKYALFPEIDEKEIVREPIKIEVLPPIKIKAKEAAGTLKGKLIVVDPGHGGEDPGALGFNGIEEKNINLNTALFLADSLRRNGASVLLTRKKDVKRSLQSVAEFVNRSGADIYIGVHYNSIIGMPMSGTETYYYNPESYRLASLVHKQMLLNLKRQDRGVRRAQFYTINHSNVPAILVEPVYITDKQESFLAQSRGFQKEIANSIVIGIKDYFLR